MILCHFTLNMFHVSCHSIYKKIYYLTRDSLKAFLFRIFLIFLVDNLKRINLLSSMYLSVSIPLSFFLPFMAYPIKDVNLNGKTVALFGMGDQQGYGQWFQDALGMLHDEICDQTITLLGKWPNDDSYEFEASKALTEDGKQFVGLALDEDSQYELSDERIASWVEQVMTEYSESL